MDKSSKKLYRSRMDKMVAGVAGGIGEYFNIDPVLIRLLFVLLALAEGAGVLLYIILIFIVPKAPITENASAEEEEEKSGDPVDEVVADVKEGVQETVKKMKDNSDVMFSEKRVLGFGVIIIGIIVLLSETFPVILLGQEIIWAILIILLGLFIIFK
ncbi:MAG: PspC domain-containing protein [Candidatus Spechtbacterales bacterium]|nr:PspC domain-containing protein [Candidatus Spechtbacterales bacterium]